MLVKDAMGIPAKRISKNDIGLEIEVEGRNLPYPDKYWRCDKDGSLRGEESMEYVLINPMSLLEVKSALNHLSKSYQLANTRVDETVRAGVHVHINCQHLSLTELYTFMTLYLVLENILIKYCGEWREGNLFCLRCQDAEWSLYRLIQAAKSRRFLHAFADDNMRYSSMNVKALADYGSLEFRAMRSTKDLKAIEDWVTILYHLRDASKEFTTPIKVIEEVSRIGCKAFLMKCLGVYSEFFNKLADVEGLLYEGIELAQSLAYCVNWDIWDKPKIVGGLEFPDDGNFYDEPFGDH